MRNRGPQTPSEPAPAWRAIVLWLCCAGAVGGLGCATMIAAESPNPRAKAHFNKPVLTDSIYALARPDAALAKQIGSPDAIAFLGKRHTYLLVEGGARLESIARELDANALSLDGGPRQLFLKDKTVWGTVALRYAPPPATAGDAAATNRLATLGFVADGAGAYRLSLPVKGVVHPPARQKKALPSEFKRPRTVAFYNPPNSSPPPDVSKLVTLPLALVVDVALTPVYVLGFVVLVLSLN